MAIPIRTNILEVYESVGKFLSTKSEILNNIEIQMTK